MSWNDNEPTMRQSALEAMGFVSDLFHFPHDEYQWRIDRKVLSTLFSSGVESVGGYMQYDPFSLEQKHKLSSCKISDGLYCDEISYLSEPQEPFSYQPIELSFGFSIDRTIFTLNEGIFGNGDRFELIMTETARLLIRNGPNLGDEKSIESDSPDWMQAIGLIDASIEAISTL
ncbi:hypothetical protein KBC31_01480 [Candidatus Saccharibacteria bacterium]|jgi:hypothetical protein|nr:hypothetical protein [Candidatus Saccharibacteria bacterium]